MSMENYWIATEERLLPEAGSLGELLESLRGRVSPALIGDREWERVVHRAGDLPVTMAAFPFGFELPLHEPRPRADFGVSVVGGSRSARVLRGAGAIGGGGLVHGAHRRVAARVGAGGVPAAPRRRPKDAAGVRHRAGAGRRPPGAAGVRHRAGAGRRLPGAAGVRRRAGARRRLPGAGDLPLSRGMAAGRRRPAGSGPRCRGRRDRLRRRLGARRRRAPAGGAGVLGDAAGDNGAGRRGLSLAIQGTSPCGHGLHHDSRRHGVPRKADWPGSSAAVHATLSPLEERGAFAHMGVHFDLRAHGTGPRLGISLFAARRSGSRTSGTGRRSSTACASSVSPWRRSCRRSPARRRERKPCSASRPVRAPAGHPPHQALARRGAGRADQGIRLPAADGFRARRLTPRGPVIPLCESGDPRRCWRGWEGKPAISP